MLEMPLINCKVELSLTWTAFTFSSEEKQLILVVKESTDCLFLLMKAVLYYSWFSQKILSFKSRKKFYDQRINNQEANDLFKQHDEVRKVSTGQGDDYTTACLLDFAYFKKVAD